MIKPKILAVAGGSASGKSSIVKLLAKEFENDLVVIGHDNYYKAHDDLAFEDRVGLNYDHPKAFDNDLFYDDLNKLLDGNDIEMPLYDYTIHTRSKQTKKISPKKLY